MNGSPDDLDTELLAHFRRDRAPRPRDPFVDITARRIDAARRRGRYLRQAGFAAALTLLVLGSRWLIAGVAYVSVKLDAWFAVGVDWLVTPLGTMIIVAGLLAALVTFLGWKAPRA